MAHRPYRGSRVSTFYPVKSVPPLSSLDSAFQLQEYISLLIRLDVHDVDTIVSLPGKASHKDADENTSDISENDVKRTEDSDRKGETSVDRGCWIYEQLRRLAQDLSHPLITSLQQECTRSSCPQMKAGEWLYLCVAHGNGGALEQCCAIDYILHTLDNATALLNSPRAFPSRLSIPQTSYCHFSLLARRLGRIFAHAYFHHREAFQQAEAESSLYARFLKLTSLYDLVPPEFLVIPERAIQPDGRSQEGDIEPPRLLAAGIHPEKDIPSDGDPVEQPYSTGSLDRRAQNPSYIEGASSAGSESPRKIGRSRTDTMVFNEALIVAEGLAKGEPGNEAESSPEGASIVQPESSEPSVQRLWTSEPSESAPGEIDDPHMVEEPVPTIPESPVEEVPLISLGELPNSSDQPATTVTPPLDPALPIPDVKEEVTLPATATVVIATHEEFQQTESPSDTQADQDDQENQLPPEADPLETLDLVDSADSPERDEGLDLPQIQLPDVPEESQPSSEPVLEPIVVEVEEADDSHSPPIAPETREFSLDLSEPPPSEPVPPESDITDEAQIHDLDEA
ncbi:Mob1/phocein [Scleroderma yunnanense]